ncbi:MAG: methyltransferase domain-containing protein [Rhodanobacteraceae bacterium]
MLATRDLVGELMDDPTLAAQAHNAALHGLRRINWISGTAAALWPRIERVLRAHPDAGASLLDVACGGGDVAIAVARRAQRHGFPLNVQGCDFSDVALEHASRAARHADVAVKFFRADVTTDALPQHYTFITCTLFLHHLTDVRIAALLRGLAGSTDHLLVSDLVRSPMGYLLAWIGTRLLSGSPIVHEDGLRSVRAALNVTEAGALAREAGLQGVCFERQWPQRFLMTWSREQDASHGSA